MKSEVLRVNLRTLSDRGPQHYSTGRSHWYLISPYLSRCRTRLYLPELSGKRAYDLTFVINEVAMVRGRHAVASAGTRTRYHNRNRRKAWRRAGDWRSNVLRDQLCHRSDAPRRRSHHLPGSRQSDAPAVADKF